MFRKKLMNWYFVIEIESRDGYKIKSYAFIKTKEYEMSEEQIDKITDMLKKQYDVKNVLILSFSKLGKVRASKK